MEKKKEILDKKLDYIFNHLTQSELAEKIGCSQWELLEKMKDNSFNKKELTQISNIYRKCYLYDAQAER
jgi:hypothetical protein